jgi:hypothetical protein
VGKKKKQKDYGDTTAEMLAVLATLDSVEALIPTSGDVDTGMVPGWCELRLMVKRLRSDDTGGDWPLSIDVPLRRHDGEMLIEVLWQVLHPDTPTSASEQLWDGLDGVVERIQARVEAGEEPVAADVVTASTLAKAIAIVNRPYDPDVDEVRAVAMTRWEIRHN